MEQVFNFMRSTVGSLSAGRVARTAAIGLGTPAAIGFAGAGGDIRGAPAGIWGDITGTPGGALKGGLALGVAGGLAGLAITRSPGARGRVGAAIETYGAKLLNKLFAKMPSSLVPSGAGKEFAGQLSHLFMTDTPRGMATMGAAAGGAVGLGLGAGIGGIVGAWSAGKNVRASQAYNQFSGIGL